MTKPENLCDAIMTEIHHVEVKNRAGEFRFHFMKRKINGNIPLIGRGKVHFGLKLRQNRPLIYLLLMLKTTENSFRTEKVKCHKTA